MSKGNGFKDRTGEVFRTKESLGGYEIEIVKYNRSTDLYVQFKDEHKAIVHAGYKECLNGSIKNPYHPVVCGVGYLGRTKQGEKPQVMEHNSKNKTREYSLWQNMINRCYNKTKIKEKPTYADCFVSDRWLCFANFLEDLPSLEGYEEWKSGENYDLDKDIKNKSDKKYYDKETCCFVKHEDNMEEVLHRRIRKKVVVRNTKTEEIKVISSATQASKDFNVNFSTLCYHLRNGGYQIDHYFLTYDDKDFEDISDVAFV